MKFSFNDGPLLCQGCGEEAVGEHDLYTGSLPVTIAGTIIVADTLVGLDVYHSDDPMLASPHFHPATALCAFCLLMTGPPVPGRWYDVDMKGQS